MPYPVQIQFKSIPYPVKVQFKSIPYPVQIQFNSSSNPFHIQFKSSSNPFHIQFKSIPYPVQIQFKSIPYPVQSKPSRITALVPYKVDTPLNIDNFSRFPPTFCKCVVNESAFVFTAMDYEGGEGGVAMTSDVLARRRHKTEIE